MDADK